MKLEDIEGVKEGKTKVRLRGWDENIWLRFEFPKWVDESGAKMDLVHSDYCREDWEVYEEPKHLLSDKGER